MAEDYAAASIGRIAERIAIRGALHAATGRLRDDPQFEIDSCTTQIANVFELATRVVE